MTSKGALKFRTAIWFCEALGKTPTEACKVVQDHERTVKKCWRLIVLDFDVLAHDIALIDIRVFMLAESLLSCGK